MPQSLAKVYLHLIFSTKNREPFITKEIRKELNGYLGGILNNLGCPTVSIESVSDHVHALFMLSRTHSISDVVEEVKKSSSRWIKEQGEAFSAFYWQAGYGVFSVSESVVESVKEYLAKQEEHHQTKSFQDEFRAFLIKHDVPFDERYVWD